MAHRNSAGMRIREFHAVTKAAAPNGTMPGKIAASDGWSEIEA